jgi:hypothetical protein
MLVSDAVSTSVSDLMRIYPASKLCRHSRHAAPRPRSFFSAFAFALALPVAERSARLRACGVELAFLFCARQYDMRGASPVAKSRLWGCSWRIAAPLQTGLFAYRGHFFVHRVLFSALLHCLSRAFGDGSAPRNNVRRKAVTRTRARGRNLEQPLLTSVSRPRLRLGRACRRRGRVASHLAVCSPGLLS